MTDQPRALIPWLTGIAIIGAIGLGLYVIGSPAKARAMKNDNARMTALKNTARVIACYVDLKDKLPDDTSEVKEALQSGKLQVSKYCNNLSFEDDPISSDPFEYIPIGEKAFEICAEFELPSRRGSKPNRYTYGGNILVDSSLKRENAGRFCYLAKNWEKRR